MFVFLLLFQFLLSALIEYGSGGASDSVVGGAVPGSVMAKTDAATKDESGCCLWSKLTPLTLTGAGRA